MGTDVAPRIQLAAAAGKHRSAQEQPMSNPA